MDDELNERTLAEAYELFHPPKIILVVEDDAEILSSLAEAIREEGYVVRTAANGFQALAEVQEHAPDLIFLDLMMPRMNGWKFVEALRRGSPATQAQIVLLSAHSDVAHEAERLGIELFLKKPFDLRDVIRVAHDCVAGGNVTPR
jgi:CheY-like chemotaxis protein